jgi:hypothetical protein
MGGIAKIIHKYSSFFTAFFLPRNDKLIHRNAAGDRIERLIMRFALLCEELNLRFH